MGSATLATSSSHLKTCDTDPTLHQHHLDVVKRVSNHEVSRRGATKRASHFDVSTFEKKKHILFIFQVGKFGLE